MAGPDGSQDASSHARECDGLGQLAGRERVEPGRRAMDGLVCKEKYRCAESNHLYTSEQTLVPHAANLVRPARTLRCKLLSFLLRDNKTSGATSSLHPFIHCSHLSHCSHCPYCDSLCSRRCLLLTKTSSLYSGLIHFTSATRPVPLLQTLRNIQHL